ncbi:MAG TPA: type II toxin-antitoxin system VapC family toxin [Gemmataceae bacterium]|nr:type II toxin-antitoxin system VapC family toxin [Gemmataceae bacterium]
MSRFLLDTDILSLLQDGHATVLQRVNSHPVSDIAVATLTLQEQMQGWQAGLNRARKRQQIALAHERLVVRLLPMWCRFAVLPFPQPAILRFEHLRSLRLNVGSMDLRIAAVGLENGLTVVTRNRRDFGRVSGLATEDWSV